MKHNSHLVALAGQPNCGKSTVFNMLTGAHQHVANYPGVTVEKKTGFFNAKNTKIELVDLPGTYSLTSYSLEERVARDFLLQEKPGVCIGVVDVSNLKRSLYLTLQLAEMDCPLILALNMMDKAEKEGVEIDLAKLEQRLGVKVVPTAAKNGQGKQELTQAIFDQSESPLTPRQADYGELEEELTQLENWLDKENIILDVPSRWLRIKLLEEDESAVEYALKKLNKGQEFVNLAQSLADKFYQKHDTTVSRHIAACRYKFADEVVSSCQQKSFTGQNITNKIDSIVCHKVFGPLILIAAIYLLYELSIVQGYKLTNYTWPILAKFKEITGWLMPAPGFVEDPLIRSMALWLVDSVNALLNYIPIFLILFGLIAVLEDSGYMPRMAFILDRLLQRFGLHGQSTLPLVLGGVYVGGCAVPAVMSTKAVPDHRARLATILVIPMLNCLAKVPLYILLINSYFSEHKGLAMFFISTISLLMALPVAKLLTLTILKKQESAPFIMEMPDYHFPTIGGILRPALQKVWLFIKKITSIVAAVAIIVFVLLRFPGVDSQTMQGFEDKGDQAIATFIDKVENSPAKGQITKYNILGLLDFANEFKQAKMKAKSKEQAIDAEAKFRRKNALYLSIVQGRPAKSFRPLRSALIKLIHQRKLIRMHIQKERIDRSFLGKMGKALEPVTQWAGFNWRVNVALLSALAAKENTVATLGALYQDDSAASDEGSNLSTSMQAAETGFTPLHALALMLFMVLYPPCLATLISIKLQTGSYKYLFFSLGYQIVLGTTVAVAVFSGGSLLGLSGLQAMIGFYILALCTAIGVGLLPNAPLKVEEDKTYPPSTTIKPKRTSYA